MVKIVWRFVTLLRSPIHHDGLALRKPISGQSGGAKRGSEKKTLKTLKQTLLASAIIAVAGGSVAQASAEDGFYLTPNAEITFIGADFNNGATGIGGGGGINLGYQISNFQIELATNYQYFAGAAAVAGKRSSTTTTQDTSQTIGNAEATAFATLYLLAVDLITQAELNGPQRDDVIRIFVNPLAAGLEGQTIDTTTTTSSNSNSNRTASTEHFIPITLGVNYVVAFNKSGSFSMTPGIAGGVWIHSVAKRTTTATTTATIATSGSNAINYNTANSPSHNVRVFDGDEVIAAAAATSTENIFDSSFTDTATTEVKGVIVPSISFDYVPTKNLTISLASKFYIVPSGYSDYYTATARTNATAIGLANENEQNFWYGSVHLGTRFTF